MQNVSRNNNNKNPPYFKYFFQTYDRWGHGFGSDGYLFDFVKRSKARSSADNESLLSGSTEYLKGAPKNDVFGYGSDGYLYDFVKRSPKNNYFGYGSDGYLYDFVKKANKN